MASQGPRYPGTGASLANAGTSESSDAWVTPGNVGADDGSEATITAATYDTPDISELLVASNFGFSIPAGSAINGIVVEIERRNSAGAASDNRVQLAIGTAFVNLVGTNKADLPTDWPTTVGVATYGSATDSWSSGLRYDQVNSSGFAVFLSAQADAANTDIQVDYIRVTIHYTEPTAVRGKNFPPGRKTPRTRPESRHPAYPTAQTVTLDVLIAGLGAVVANFVRERAIQSSISGTGAVSPNVVRDKRVLATSIAGAGSVVTTFLARTRPLAAVISGLGTVAADLIRIKELASSIAGTGAVVANFVRDKRALNVVVAGTGAITAAFVRTRVLAASISGTGTLAAANSVTRSIATVIAGQGALAAVYVRNQRVFGTTIGGIGTVVADLTVTGGGAVLAKLRTLMGVGQ